MSKDTVHYWARNDPAKITDSKMALFSRDCLVVHSQQKSKVRHKLHASRHGPAIAVCLTAHTCFMTARVRTPPKSQARKSTLRAAPACSESSALASIPPERAPSRCVCVCAAPRAHRGVFLRATRAPSSSASSVDIMGALDAVGRRYGSLVHERTARGPAATNFGLRALSCCLLRLSLHRILRYVERKSENSVKGHS